MPIEKKKVYGKCDDCKKKLIVPTWRRCADCDFKRFEKKYKKKHTLSATAIKRNNRVLRNYTRSEKIKNASILITDEKGNVIGYSSSTYKLGE
jgi:hypothetical protein